MTLHSVFEPVIPHAQTRWTGCQGHEKGVVGNRGQHAQRDQESAIGCDRFELAENIGEERWQMKGDLGGPNR